jgi:hypothetical protein
MKDEKTMANIFEIKESIVNPIKRTIEQYKSPALSQFKSFDDVKIQWYRAEGMEMTLNHIETVYAAFKEATPTPTIENDPKVEILPPNSKS